METKPIDLERVLSEISAGEKRSQRRSVIYTVVSLLIGGVWLAYSIFEVSRLWEEASTLRTESTRLEKEITSKTNELRDLSERTSKLKKWGWLPETIAKADQSVSADHEFEAIKSATDTPENLERRRKLTIEYFFKDVDPDRVWEALGELGFTRPAQPSPALGKTPTNAVWFGRSVQRDDVKLVAYALIRAGIQIRAIRPFLVSEGRDSLIQVGGRPLAVDQEVWSVERISAAKEFPRE